MTIGGESWSQAINYLFSLSSGCAWRLIIVIRDSPIISSICCTFKSVLTAATAKSVVCNQKRAICYYFMITIDWNSWTRARRWNLLQLNPAYILWIQTVLSVSADFTANKFTLFFNFCTSCSTCLTAQTVDNLTMQMGTGERWCWYHKMAAGEPNGCSHWSLRWKGALGSSLWYCTACCSGL